jgi:hypothetical protein
MILGHLRTARDASALQNKLIGPHPLEDPATGEHELFSTRISTDAPVRKKQAIKRPEKIKVCSGEP